MRLGLSAKTELVLFEVIHGWKVFQRESLSEQGLKHDKNKTSSTDHSNSFTAETYGDDASADFRSVLD